MDLLIVIRTMFIGVKLAFLGAPLPRAMSARGPENCVSPTEPVEDNQDRACGKSEPSQASDGNPDDLSNRQQGHDLDVWQPRADH